MARPRSKARSTRNGKHKNSLKQREYRDQQGRVQLHTRNYKGGEASQSGEPQKRRRSPSPSSKRPSDQSDQGSNLGPADRLSRPRSKVAQPGSEGRSTRNGKNSLNRGEASQSGEPQKPPRSSSTSSSDQSDQASNFGNLAQSILADRPGLLLAAAAAAGTFLISRWLGENGWLRRSFGRGGDGESFIPGGSWGQAQVRPNRNEANSLEPAQHTGIDRGDVDSEASFEVAQASQQDAVAQAGDQSDRVEGTAVFDLNGQQIGRLRRLMIAKVGGQVLYAIMEFDDLVGNGTDEYAIPWSKLEYDTTLQGYRTDITQEQLQNAPEFSRDQNHDRSDQQSQRDLPQYFEVPITGLRPDRLGSVPRSSC
jgi:PRC-barrel domain